jgi:DNA-binding HxlR family transcriptional regulator
MVPAAAGHASEGLEAALALVGDRWALLVVDALQGGPLRFGELQQALSGIATNVLSERLRRLERHGVVIAVAHPARPPRHAYVLSAAGTELAGALLLLARWGSRHEGASGGGGRSGSGRGDAPGNQWAGSQGMGPAGAGSQGAGSQGTGSQGTGEHGPHHRACGTPLEPRWYCPTCDGVVPDDEADAGELRWV